MPEGPAVAGFRALRDRAHAVDRADLVAEHDRRRRRGPVRRAASWRRPASCRAGSCRARSVRRTPPAAHRARS